MKSIALLIEILKKINTGAVLTKQEIGNMSGFGAMSFLLRDWDNISGWSSAEKANFKYMPELQEQLHLFSDRTKIQYQSIQQDLRNAVLSSYYTPPEIIDTLTSASGAFALKTGEKIQSILEPSAGSGRFFEALHNRFPDAAIDAIEKNSISALVAREYGKQISGNIRVYNNVYENLPYGK